MSIDGIENMFDVYHGKNKKNYESLKENSMKIINFENKKCYP